MIEIIEWLKVCNRYYKRLKTVLIVDFSKNKKIAFQLKLGTNYSLEAINFSPR